MSLTGYNQLSYFNFYNEVPWSFIQNVLSYGQPVTYEMEEVIKSVSLNKRENI